MLSDSSHCKGRKAARELPWQQLLQYPEQEAGTGAGGVVNQQQELHVNQPPIPLDLQTQGVLFQLFQLQAGAAGPDAGSAGVGLAENAQQQQLPQPPQQAQPRQQQDAPPATVVVKKEPEHEPSGDAVQLAAAAAAAESPRTFQTAAAAQEEAAKGLAGVQPTAAAAEPQQMQLDDVNAAQKHGIEQQYCTAGDKTGQVVEAVELCTGDSPEAKRQRV
jgi:hypothetical protein